MFQFAIQKNISDEENEELTKELEKFTFYFPIFFPEQNLTRKMHVFSFVLPIFMGYKMLQLEQKTESLHHTLNDLERGLVNLADRGRRLITAVKLYQNKKKVDMSLFRK